MLPESYLLRNYAMINLTTGIVRHVSIAGTTLFFLAAFLHLAINLLRLSTQVLQRNQYRETIRQNNIA